MRTMATDPLSVLRQYNIDKKEIVEENDKIIMGDHSWPKNVPTYFREFGTGRDGKPKKYYTLETLLFFLKNKSLKHPEYIQQAVVENIPTVHRPDRRDLLAYLNGEKNTCGSIDEGEPLEIPAPIKRSATDESQESVAEVPDFERLKNKRRKGQSLETDVRTMVDPLSLLRQYTIEKKEIVEKNDQIIFGEYSFSKYVPTSFMESKGSFRSPKKYYTLEAVLLCLKHQFSVKEYRTQTLDEDVSFICRKHRRVLLPYLNGKKATCYRIDENVPWKIPIQDAKLPTSAKPPSPLELCNFNKKTGEKSDQFSCEEYSRFKSASMNFSEFDTAKATQRKKTPVPEPAKFVESEDGSRKLLDGPYSFTKDKEIKNRTYWRCEFQVLCRCPARITTIDDQIESKWRSHDHWQSKSPPGIEVIEIKKKTKINASDTETSRINNENVNSLSGTNIETIKANAQDVNCQSIMKSETTRKLTENINSLNSTNIETIRANAQNVNCRSVIKSEIIRKDAENVISLNSGNIEPIKADSQYIDCLSAVLSETTKEDTENINSFNSTNIETIQANAQDVNYQSARKSETTRKDTVTVNSLNNLNLETIKTNPQDVPYLSVIQSETAKEDTENINSLNDTNIETIQTNAQDVNYQSARNSETIRKDTETVNSLNGMSIATIKADSQDFPCLSAIRLETAKEDAKNINSLNDTNIETIQTNTQDVNYQSARKLETTRKDTETVNSLNGMSIETIKADSQDFPCLSAIQSETAKEDTENVNSLNDTNIETIQENARDVNCQSDLKLEMPRKDIENVNILNVTNMETMKANAQGVNCWSIMKLETTRKDSENINSLNGTNIETIQANAQDINCRSAIKSETRRKDTKNVHHLNRTNMETIKANAQSVTCQSVIKSETTRKDTENVNSLNGTNIETIKANARDVNCLSAIWSETTKEDTETNSDSVDNSSDTHLESGNQDAQEADTLMLSVLNLFDEMASKIVDGANDFLEEEFSLISLIYSLFHRLMALRKFNGALDSVMTDLHVAYAEENLSENLRSTAKRVDFSTESSESDSSEVATPSKQLRGTAETQSLLSEASESEVADVSVPAEDAETDDSASESSESDKEDISNVNLSEKITCVCVICDKPIDIPPDRDIQSVMEAHLYSLHPSRLDPLDPASDSDEDESSESDEESEPLNDPMILLDGTKLEDFEVKFDRANALKYITHSNGIFLNKKNAYICFVCGSYMPLEKHLGHHLKSRAHRVKIREYCRHSIAAKSNHVVAVDPDIFVIRQGKLYCLECQVHFLNPHSFLSHVSKRHEQKLKLDFPIVCVGGIVFCTLCDRRIKVGRSALDHAAEKQHYVEYLKVTTVVQLRSIKFCSLCNVKLFTESQYNSHVNDDSHISNLELIETIVSGLKFGKKSK